MIIDSRKAFYITSSLGGIQVHDIGGSTKSNQTKNIYKELKRLNESNNESLKLEIALKQSIEAHLKSNKDGARAVVEHRENLAIFKQSIDKIISTKNNLFETSANINSEEEYKAFIAGFFDLIEDSSKINDIFDDQTRESVKEISRLFSGGAEYATEKKLREESKRLALTASKGRTRYEAAKKPKNGKEALKALKLAVQGSAAAFTGVDFEKLMEGFGATKSSPGLTRTGSDFTSIKDSHGNEISIAKKTFKADVVSNGQVQISYSTEDKFKNVNIEDILLERLSLSIKSYVGEQTKTKEVSLVSGSSISDLENMLASEERAQMFRNQISNFNRSSGTAYLVGAEFFDFFLSGSNEGYSEYLVLIGGTKRDFITNLKVLHKSSIYDSLASGRVSLPKAELNSEKTTISLKYRANIEATKLIYG